VLLLGLLALAGCATSREGQVRTALTNAGVPQPVAQCMAEPLARDLSNEQLRSLARVAKLARTPTRAMTVEEAMNVIRREVDPGTVAVVLRAGLGCFVRG
jgi:hypothetical protein